MANTNADIIRAEFASTAILEGASGVITGQVGFVTVSPYKMGHKELGGSYRYWSSDDGDREQTGKVTITKTTEQLRLRYDASYYTSFTVSAAGDLTITPSGTDLIVGAGKYLKLGHAMTYGTASVNGTIPVKDSDGNTTYLCFCNTAAA